MDDFDLTIYNYYIVAVVVVVVRVPLLLLYCVDSFRSHCNNFVLCCALLQAVKIRVRINKINIEITARRRGFLYMYICFV